MKINFIIHDIDLIFPQSLLSSPIIQVNFQFKWGHCHNNLQLCHRLSMMQYGVVIIRYNEYKLEFIIYIRKRCYRLWSDYFTSEISQKSCEPI